jgi:flavin-binding protein dodecin
MRRSRSRSAFKPALIFFGAGHTVGIGEPFGSQPGRASDKEAVMAESVYKVIELVGSSTESWEAAATAAVARASQTLRDLRIAEVVEMDMHIEDGKVLATGRR